jgi:hypothetical protein
MFEGCANLPLTLRVSPEAHDPRATHATHLAVDTPDLQMCAAGEPEVAFCSVGTDPRPTEWVISPKAVSGQLSADQHVMRRQAVRDQAGAIAGESQHSEFRVGDHTTGPFVCRSLWR